MSSLVSNPPARWRIVWALIRKEVINIVQHPHYLIMMATPLLISLMFRFFFPAILFQEDRLKVAIAAPAGSALVIALEARDDVDVEVVADETAVLASFADEVTAGLVLPDGFETAVAAGESPPLTIYLHDNAPDKFQSQVQHILSEQIWALQNAAPPANLSWELTDGNVGAPLLNSSVNNYMFITVATLGLSMVGIGLLPQIMTEEKEKSALIPLMASPVTYADYIVAKAAVGLVYTIILVALIALTSDQTVQHGTVAATAFLLGAIFFTGVGLILGIQLKTKAQCNAWTGIMILLFYLPIWFSIGSLDSLPVGAAILLQLIPTHYLVDMFTFAVTGSNSGFVPSLLIFIVTTVLIYIVVVWMVRKRPLLQQF
ncbi:MAG: ABC transporter permease [Chloroflexi bacterium]|nr:ABC transporter permease [Chloroflexota bacterium]